MGIDAPPSTPPRKREAVRWNLLDSRMRGNDPLARHPRASGGLYSRAMKLRPQATSPPRKRGASALNFLASRSRSRSRFRGNDVPSRE